MSQHGGGSVAQCQTCRLPGRQLHVRLHVHPRVQPRATAACTPAWRWGMVALDSRTDPLLGT